MPNTVAARLAEHVAHGGATRGGISLIPDLQIAVNGIMNRCHRDLLQASAC
jgi:hypothetical protein